MNLFRSDRQQASSSSRKAGHAVVEVALLAPWILLLLPAIYDFGIYTVALITVENAARAAALQTSDNPDAAIDNDLACSAVLAQMKKIPNATRLQGCSSLPLQVSATVIPDTEGFMTSRVAVTYQTAKLFPLPFLSGQLTLTRTAQMRVRP